MTIKKWYHPFISIIDIAWFMLILVNTLKSIPVIVCVCVVFYINLKWKREDKKEHFPEQNTSGCEVLE